MSKTDINKIIVVIFISIINSVGAFIIPHLLGIANIVIVDTFTIIYGKITWEVVIFLSLSFIEVLIYEMISKKVEIKPI